MIRVAEVVVENLKSDFNFFYSYYIPFDLVDRVEIGSRVRVPFGREESLRTAFVVNLSSSNDAFDDFKFVNSMVDESKILTSREVSIAKWISETCCCGLFETLNSFIPSQIKNKKFTLKTDDLKISDFNFEDINLSDTQGKVFDKLSSWAHSDEYSEALLYGITGSGKTSVFLKLAQDVLKNGGCVLVLVPEISLIPQTMSNIEKYFGKNTFACIHSGLTPKKRATEWLKIRSGNARLVIGTRSAILSPFEKVDLIIMDEEQESTYKSDSTPRFHARNVARFLCKKFKAKLLLSSATPSIESFYYAKSGKSLLFELKERYGGSCLPSVKVVNIRRNRMNVDSFLSDELIDAMYKTISDEKQVILLLDRRGFHTLARCMMCGSLVMCINCNLTLSHHVVGKKDKLICHHCGFTRDIPTKCDQCGSDKILLGGVGTQNLENEISNILQGAKCLRVDADTTTSKKAYEKMFKDFRDKKFNVMIGTRMVAKGLDFNDVNLVGVICADQALFGEEYKAYEKMFSLVSQVVGRSGRKGKNGLALIQTFCSDNPIIEMASKQDYDVFFESEISMRKKMIYPPFIDICLIGFVGSIEEDTWNACRLFFEVMKEIISKDYPKIPIKILYPTSAFLKKAFNKFRFKIIIKCVNNTVFRELLKNMFLKYNKTNNKNDIYISSSRKNKVRIFIDFNPETVF